MSDMNIQASAFKLRGRGRLTDVVTELQRQVDQRVDFVADTRDMSVQVDKVDGVAQLRLMPSDSLRDWMPREGVQLLPQAVTQLFGRIGTPMPTKFGRDAMDKVPQRFADYVNGVMRDLNRRWFIRCLDDRVRAVLSDRYRVIESLDVARAALQGAREHGDGVRVLEASVTDTHVRIRLVNTAVWGALEDKAVTAWDTGNIHQFARPGDRASAERRNLGQGFDDVDMQGGDTTLWPLVEVGNSDTGHGGQYASIGLIQAICLNTCVQAQEVAHVHLGQRMRAGMFGQDTVTAEGRAIALKCRDVVKTAFDERRFRQLVEQAKAADAKEVTGPVTAFANIVKVDPTLADNDMDELVAAFSCERPSVYGVAQAISRVAQDRPVDKAVDMERLAGDIIGGKFHDVVLAGAAQ